MGRLSNVPRKIVVGVDYGTTFSGIAFATSAESSENPEDIMLWPNPQGDGSLYRKVPSRIAYLEENERKEDYEYTRSAWGYEVQPGWNSYTWTKLLLDAHTQPTDWDDPRLEHEQVHLNQGVLKLPKGKTALDVCSDYLQHLYKHCIRQLESHYKAALFKATPIEFWFTHPAIWSDEAKNATLIAAKRAGFGSRQGVSDSVNLISEPEAAAIATLRSPDDEPHGLKKNKGVLICDVGGGTVDITTYRVRQIEPLLQVDEACVGDGGKCGSTMIDRNFHDLMCQKFGVAFSTLPAPKIGPGSKFMREFEFFKKGFEGNLKRRYQCRLNMPILKKQDTAAAYYDFDEKEIKFTGKEMKDCFDPVIERIIELLGSQLKAVMSKKLTPIETIIFVGGFADSEYLWREIRAWRNRCHPSIDVITPKTSPWSAIARGAALRGLDGSLVLKRKCRRHYGVSVSKEFDAVRDQYDLKENFWTHPDTGKKMAMGCMHWVFHRGQILVPGREEDFTHVEHLSEEEFERRSKYNLEMFSCVTPDAPPKMNKNVIQPNGIVELDLKDVSLADCKYTRNHKNKIYAISLKTYIIPEGKKTGQMDVRVVWKDHLNCERVCGSAELTFSTD